MSIYQEKAKECKCCGKHVPLPTVLMWKSLGARPPGNIRKHFSDYVQQLVETTIDKNEDGTL